MTTLHIVANPGAFNRCLDLVLDGDAVLLIEDGVYAAATASEVARRTPSATIAALEVDMAARGVQQTDAVDVRDYAGFVELVVEHSNSVTWT